MRHFPVPLRLAAVLAATLAGTGCMNVGEDPAGSTSSGATAGVAHESPDGGTGTLRAVPQGGETPGRAGPGGARPEPSASPSPRSGRPTAKDLATPDGDRPGPRPSKPTASRPDRPAPPTRPAPTGRPSTPGAPTPTRTRPPEPPTSAPPTPEPSDTPEEPQPSDPGEEGDAARTHQREQRAPDQSAAREQDSGTARSDEYTPAP
ncbi:hypothetical protein [Streptomyces sp. NPDC058426]|uniref:hypothetical protein n=1 Tax=Streptomyces sp. NPDC058426 TaxID=3346493 RepID=UPI00364724FF